MDEARGSIPLSSTVTLPPAAVQAPRRLVPMRTHHGSPDVTVGVLFGHEPEPFAPERPDDPDADLDRVAPRCQLRRSARSPTSCSTTSASSGRSYIVAVAFFTLVEVILGPLITKMAITERAGTARGHRPGHDAGRADLHRPHLRRVQHHRCLDLGRGDRHRLARWGARRHRPAVDLPPQQRRRDASRAPQQPKGSTWAP